MKVAVVHGNRADWAALKPVADAFSADWVFVDTPASQTRFDSAVSGSQAMVMAAEQYDKFKPDLVFIPGDRFEILGAACAAHLMNIPIAHLSGGDITEGSQDNASRNAISKLASLHFAADARAAAQLMSMDVPPWDVHNVGCPSIDTLKATKLLNRSDTLALLGFDCEYWLIAYQPATLDADPLHEADEMLTALRSFQTPCVFTTANTDVGGNELNRRFARYCLEHPGWGRLFKGTYQEYLSVMKHCKVMIGNSSSGFYEAPALKVPFVNIGYRQRGRTAAKSILHAAPERSDITRKICGACLLDCTKVVSPYGLGHATERIKGVVEQWASTRFGKKSTGTTAGAPIPRKSSSVGCSGPGVGSLPLFGQLRGS